jgi:hypothetical protein
MWVEQNSEFSLWGLLHRVDENLLFVMHLALPSAQSLEFSSSTFVAISDLEARFEPGTLLKSIV